MAVGRHGGDPARGGRSAAFDRAHALHAQRRLSCSTIRRVRSQGAPITVFDGELDADGKARIEKDLDLPRDVPGMLNATFITRVFERGGAFSINRETRTVAAFDRYVGLKLPKGDAARDMLLTDTKHVVELATLDADGEPVSVPRLQVTLYKVQWRWWWDSSGDSLAQYAQGESTSVIKQDTIATKDGRGQWEFEIKYPEWGRYLVRACDLDGGHCTGRVFYIDWPSWAGAARDQSGPAANILMLTSDKQEYQVGETATVQLPEASQGRALLTLESGSAILEQRWLEAKPGANRVSIPITAGMAPNIYAAVTMVQPHAGKTNDRPIRLYGVIPLKVTDPAVASHAARHDRRRMGAAIESQRHRQRNSPAAPWTTRWPSSTKDC